MGCLQHCRDETAPPSQVWYRAEVCSVRGNEALVYYVDYGNTELVPVSALRSPAPSTFAMPYQAVCCTLACFRPASGSVASAATALSSLVLDKELVASFHCRSSARPHPYCPTLPCFAASLLQTAGDDTSSVGVALSGRGLGHLAVCPAHVRVGGSGQVFTTFVDSPGVFWVQFAESAEKVDSVQEALNDPTTVAALKPLPPQNLVSGAACCAVYSQDSTYYRCEVVTVTRDKVKVQFVDYGNSETVTASSLMGLPPRVALVPAQAVQCCLEGVKPLKPRKQGTAAWSKESSAAFEELTDGCSLEAVFVSEISPEIFSIHLSDADTGQSVGAALAAAALAELATPMPAPPSDTGQGLEAGKGVGLEAGQGAGLEVGRSYNIFVSHAESPAIVWCQRSEFADEFGRLMEALAQHYASEASRPRPLSGPAPDQLCCVRFSEDGEFYRGAVQSVEAGSAEVLFVDYGNAAVVPVGELLALECDLTRLPAQAASFSMHGIAPPTQGEWSLQAAAKFKELCLEKELSCQVVSLDGDGFPACR